MSGNSRDKQGYNSKAFSLNVKPSASIFIVDQLAIGLSPVLGTAKTTYEDDEVAKTNEFGMGL